MAGGRRRDTPRGHGSRRLEGPHPLHRAHRDLYEDELDERRRRPLRRGPDPATHGRPSEYVALAQVFAESGVQFDVVYAGDGRFNPEELDPGALERYRTILVPEARDLGAAPAAALTSFARAGGELVIFSEHSLDRTLGPRSRRGHAARVLAGLPGRGSASDRRERRRPRVRADRMLDPGVGVVRYASGDRQVFHLLDYRYDPRRTRWNPSSRLRIPWQRADAVCTLLSPGDVELTTKVENGTLSVDVPTLDPYAVLVAGQSWDPPTPPPPHGPMTIVDVLAARGRSGRPTCRRPRSMGCRSVPDGPADAPCSRGSVDRAPHGLRRSTRLEEMAIGVRRRIRPGPGLWRGGGVGRARRGPGDRRGRRGPRLREHAFGEVRGTVGFVVDGTVRDSSSAIQGTPVFSTVRAGASDADPAVAREPIVARSAGPPATSSSPTTTV